MGLRCTFMDLRGFLAMQIFYLLSFFLLRTVIVVWEWVIILRAVVKHVLVIKCIL